MPSRVRDISFDVPKEKMDGGFFIQHGYRSDISARSISGNGKLAKGPLYLVA